MGPKGKPQQTLNRLHRGIYVFLSGEGRCCFSLPCGFLAYTSVPLLRGLHFPSLGRSVCLHASRTHMAPVPWANQSGWQEEAVRFWTGWGAEAARCLTGGGGVSKPPRQIVLFPADLVSAQNPLAY